MPWKRKEKELTEEEAIQLAREEVTPYWFNSTPLVAPASEANRVTIFPLEKSFLGKSWLILFFDPTSLTNLSFLKMMSAWYERYQKYGLHFLMVCQPRYGFFEKEKIVKKIVDQHKIKFPVVFDHDFNLSHGFKATTAPLLRLARSGEIVFDCDQIDKIPRMELLIHEDLRKEDPGLPLLPAIDVGVPPQDDEMLEFPKSFASSAKLVDKPLDFEDVEAYFRQEDRSRFLLQGAWKKSGDVIYTEDPKAELHFLSPSPSMALLAKSMSETAEKARLFVEMNGRPVIDQFCGKHMRYEEDGSSVIDIRDSELYYALVDMPDDERLLSFKFPLAKRIALGIYGFRFANTLT